MFYDIGEQRYKNTNRFFKRIGIDLPQKIIEAMLAQTRDGESFSISLDFIKMTMTFIKSKVSTVPVWIVRVEEGDKAQTIQSYLASKVPMSISISKSGSYSLRGGAISQIGAAVEDLVTTLRDAVQSGQDIPQVVYTTAGRVRTARLSCQDPKKPFNTNVVAFS